MMKGEILNIISHYIKVKDSNNAKCYIVSRGGGEDINMTKHILEGNYERTTFSANISENIRNYFKILMNLQRLGGIHAFLICHMRAINIYTSEGMDK